jgi:hypothetical protein
MCLLLLILIIKQVIPRLRELGRLDSREWSPNPNPNPNPNPDPNPNPKLILGDPAFARIRSPGLARVVARAHVLPGTLG